MALGGWIAAPAIGAALGSAVGLAGAAATAHGLALIGGGSLAAGGYGMAGGMWIITGLSAAAGATTFSTANVLTQIGVKATNMELMKLQVYYKEMMLGSTAEQKKVEQIILELTKQKAELKTKHQYEKERNENNSHRIKGVEETIKAVELAIKSMS